MDDISVAAITVKNLGDDEHGLRQYMWATKKQAQQLLDLQFDEKKNHFVYMLGDESIRPCDILAVKFVKIKEARRWPAFRGYVLDALKAEIPEVISIDKSNKENLKRLEKLKAAHKTLGE